MGLETALILGGAGTIGGAASDFFNQRSQRRRANRLEGRVDEYMQGEGGGTSFLENLLRSQFNVGQDGGMQALRASPGESSLRSMLATGNPFDTSSLFEALAPIRQRQHSEGLGTLQAGAPGLGQRFGSAMMRQGADLTERHLQNIAAQDAQTQFQSHEAAQGRMLGSNMGIMQLLAGLEQGRQGRGLQALGLMTGIPQPQGMNFGQPFMDFGQLLMLNQLIGGGGTTPSPTPFTRQPLPTFNPPTLF